MSYMDDTGYITLTGNRRLAYSRTPGIQPGVVFLCGLRSDMTGRKAMWLDTWCRRRQRSFLRFDYSGHGHSSGRFEDGTLGTWLDDTLQALDRLAAGPQVLVGSSMGGWLMLLAALARPRQVAGLLGISTAPDFTEERIRPLLTPAHLEELERQGITYGASSHMDEPLPITRRFLDEARRHCLLGSSIGLRQPLRLVHGMLDEEVPWRTAMRVADGYAGRDVHIHLIKDGEHRLSRDSDLTFLSHVLDELTTVAEARLAQG